MIIFEDGNNQMKFGTDDDGIFYIETLIIGEEGYANAVRLGHKEVEYLIDVLNEHYSEIK